MIIGILKEGSDENRVSMLPESIAGLKDLGLDVLVESEAGSKSYANDASYKESGAEVVDNASIFNKADIILKIAAPTDEELGQLSEGKYFISMFQPLVNTEIVEKLKNSKVTSFSLDSIPRISRAQTMDILSSQATLAGYKAVLIAATHLPTFFPMLSTAAGSIPPAKVLVIGAGVAGLMAIATARRLGAVVHAFDTRPEVKEEVESLGGKFVEVEGAADASEAGGYAVEQTEEYKKRQAESIKKAAIKSNVIITTAQIPGKKAPLIITKDIVDGMVRGSVIVDLAASSGGNCELTKNNETIDADGIIIIGDSNLPSSIPYDASRMFGKNVLTFLKLLIVEGKVNLDFEDEIISDTCITHNGENRLGKKPEAPKEEPAKEEPSKETSQEQEIKVED